MKVVFGRYYREFAFLPQIRLALKDRAFLDRNYLEFAWIIFYICFTWSKRK